MCTYDYTPYRGCGRGQQHFYLQWMKCNKALENGNKLCPINQSVEVEELKKLSGNVLFCPMHNPIAVQQHEFLFLAHNDQDGPFKSPRRPEDLRSRSQSTRGRPVEAHKAAHSSENSLGEPVRKMKRERVPKALNRPPSPESESESPVPRPRTASGVKRLDDHKIMKDQKSLARTRSHRRVSSVEFASLPTLSETRTPTSENNSDARRVVEGVPVPERDRKPEVPALKSPGPLSPGMRARLGLPVTPDMHRRSTVVHRSRSESPLQQTEFKMAMDGPATDPEFGHPLFSQDSSPELKSEAFASKPAVHRGRTMVRRIEEDRRVEKEPTSRLVPTPKREVHMTFLDQEHQPDRAVGLGLRSPGHKRVSRSKSESGRSASAELKLDAALRRQSKYVRDEATTSDTISTPASIASAEHGSPPDQPFSYVHKSVRSSRQAPDDDEEDATTVLNRKREARKSRRYEDQVAEAKKWAAARDEHFTSLSPGQQQQQPSSPQRQTTLHKTHPSTTTEGSFEMDTKHIQQMVLPVTMKKDDIRVTTISAVQPGKDEVTAAAPTQTKGSLLKRMGLKRKISSLWEKNGNGGGAAAVAAS